MITIEFTEYIPRGAGGLLVAMKQKLIGMAYADNTKRCHNDQLATYEKFCERIGDVCPMWSVESCTMWVLDALDRGLAKETLKAKISAFIWGAATRRNIKYDANDPTHVLYLLRKAVLRLGDDAKPKLPVGGVLLKRIAQHLTSSLTEARTTQAMAWFTVAYAALLRASESAQLEWDDVAFSETENRMGPERMEITLTVKRHHVFKTHTKSVLFRFSRGKDAAACPVAWMWRWYRHTMKRLGNLPRKVFSWGQEEARHVLQTAAVAVTQGSRSDFGLHSLRAGGATDADSQGFSVGQIQLLGRWRSAVVLHYIRAADELADQWGIAQRRGGSSVTAFPGV